MLLNGNLALGLLYPALANAVRYGNVPKATTYVEPDKMAYLFPDIPVDLYSPIFTMPETVPAGFANGTSGPTPQATMEAFYKSIADRNSWLTYHIPDFKSDDGRNIPYLVLSTSPVSPLLSKCGGTGKVRVYIQGGVHGNEPMGDQSVMALIGQMDSNSTWAEEILSKVDILVVPRYNPDGVHYFQRTLITNLDPNRDHAKQGSYQTRHIKQLVNQFAPHIGVDVHEFGVGSWGPNGTYLNAEDVQFSAMKNLNVNSDIRRLSETLFTNTIAAAMERRGLRWGPYIVTGDGEGIAVLETTPEPRFGDVTVSLGQAVMFLCELRGGAALGNQHVQRRVASGLTFLETFVQTAADNADYVYSTIEGGRSKFIHSNDPIVISDVPTDTHINYTFVDSATGKLVSVPVLFQNTTQSVPKFTRRRPEAYLIPPGWYTVIERLRTYNLNMTILDAPFHGEVEALFMNTVSIATSAYEGVVMATLTANTTTMTVDLPAGTYLISTRQKNAAHLFGVLEPEGPDSYARNYIIPQNRGDEWPVYRVMTPVE